MSQFAAGNYNLMGVVPSFLCTCVYLASGSFLHFIYIAFVHFQSVLDGEITLWGVPDVLIELYEHWTEITTLLRVPSQSGMVDSLDFVLCGDLSVPLRLHALSIVFSAREYLLLICTLMVC